MAPSVTNKNKRANGEKHFGTSAKSDMAVSTVVYYGDAFINKYSNNINLSNIQYVRNWVYKSR